MCEGHRVACVLNVTHRACLLREHVPEPHFRQILNSTASPSSSIKTMTDQHRQTCDNNHTNYKVLILNSTNYKGRKKFIRKHSSTFLFFSSRRYIRKDLRSEPHTQQLGVWITWRSAAAGAGGTRSRRERIH